MQQWPQGTLIDFLSPLARAALISAGSQQDFQPGQHLVREGERSTGVYLLLSDCAKVTGNTIDGKLVTIDIRVAGDLVGEFAALDGGLRSSTVTAATSVAVRFISQPEFRRLLSAHSPTSATAPPCAPGTAASSSPTRSCCAASRTCGTRRCRSGRPVPDHVITCAPSPDLSQG
jgi:hypothetical protein